MNEPTPMKCTHPESDQQWALYAVRDAISRADSALAKAKEKP
jgi:hypothetical protein